MLHIDAESDVTEEFQEFFEKHYKKKEIYFPQLKNTVLDVDRWIFSPDLRISLLSVPLYYPDIKAFEQHQVIYCDIESKLSHVTLATIKKLKNYIRPEDKNDFELYMEYLIIGGR